MEYSDLNELERIGLAFVSGLIAGNALEKEGTEEVEEKPEPKHMAEECEVEVKKITQKEMADILDNLKNKILGGK